MELAKQQLRKLRAEAHHKKAVVMIGGKGLTEQVTQEIDHALEAHELIKIKVSGADKVECHSFALQICETCQAALIQEIGHVIAIYRKKKLKRKKKKKVRSFGRGKR